MRRAIVALDRRADEATSEHIVEEIDRLDHLAQKYYQQPRTWWHICDANPALLSPRALLGHEPLVTAQFPLTWEGPDPPWSDLLAVLGQTLGVEAARMGTPEQDHPEVAYLDGAPDFPITTPADLSVLQGVAAYLPEGTPPAARQSA